MHRTNARSVAAPAGTHDASPPPATNGKAPVTPRQGAAIERARATATTPHSGAAASGAGIAGMAGPAGPARPVVPTPEAPHDCALGILGITHQSLHCGNHQQRGLAAQ